MARKLDCLRVHYKVTRESDSVTFYSGKIEGMHEHAVKYACDYVYVSMRGVCTRVYVCARVCVCLCVCVCVCVCMYVCV